jgi:hypothetical protein
VIHYARNGLDGNARQFGYVAKSDMNGMRLCHK